MLRDLESKVVLENCLPHQEAVPQPNQVGQKEFTQPIIEGVTFDSTSSHNLSELDITQLPILEEYR